MRLFDRNSAISIITSSWNLFKVLHNIKVHEIIDSDTTVKMYKVLCLLVIVVVLIDFQSTDGKNSTKNINWIYDSTVNLKSLKLNSIQAKKNNHSKC